MTTTYVLFELPDTVDDGQSLLLDLGIASFCLAESLRGEGYRFFTAIRQYE